MRVGGLSRAMCEAAAYAADCDAAYKSLDKWMDKSAGHSHKTLSSADLRSENLLWRRTGPDAYECVSIDHQAWWFAPPTRDIAMLLATSLPADKIKPEFENCARAYLSLIHISEPTRPY